MWRSPQPLTLEPACDTRGCHNTPGCQHPLITPVNPKTQSEVRKLTKKPFTTQHQRCMRAAFFSKPFSTQRSLKRHRESVHRQSAGFSCQVCSKHFYRQDVLRKHMKTHQPAVPAPDVRGPSAGCPPDSATNLPGKPTPEKHREMHVCDVCRKTFSTQKTLKRHRESTHRQSAGFACGLCDQRFYRKDNLRKHHTRKHADEEYETPAGHTCSICQKSFHYRGHFRQHLKTHQPT